MVDGVEFFGADETRRDGATGKSATVHEVKRVARASRVVESHVRLAGDTGGNITF